MSKPHALTPSLPGLLKQSQAVRDLVEACAEDLSKVNSGIARELENVGNLPGVESALNKNLQVEDTVNEASEKLAVMTSGLEDQVRDRKLLDYRFAAVLEQEEAARHAALYDALTDLPNRALFNDRLEHGLAQAKRHGWALAVMFIDLDAFKGINDAHGHEVGDCVLQEVGRRLKRITRSDDTISRYGGDEFLYLLLEIQDEVHVASAAEKIIDTLQIPWAAVQGITVPAIGGSIGIALFPKDGATAQTLIRKADAAMYVAKRNKMGYAFAAQGHGL
jgi:diguanylate cyclase